MPLLDTITGPDDLRRLRPDQLPELAEEVRQRLIDVVSHTGGHIGAGVFQRVRSPARPIVSVSGVISLFIRALVEGRRPTIFGDGEQTRDFTYVANVVDGVTCAPVTPRPAGGQIINVATGGRVSLNALFSTLRGLLEATVEPEYAAPRAGDVRHSQADITLARRLLEYEPSVPFDEGLRRTVDWYRSSAVGGRSGSDA